MLCECVLETCPTDTIVHFRSHACWCNSKHEYRSDNGHDSQEHSQLTWVISVYNVIQIMKPGPITIRNILMVDTTKQ